MTATKPTARVGVTGLDTMGRNLARNLARHGHVVAVHNRTTAKTDALVDHFGHEGDFVACAELKDLVAAIATPRVVIVMVKAGDPTDAVIDALVPLLDDGDVVVDGGNAHVDDSRRRSEELEEKGLQFVGCGISGGEVGALEGPSIMPGCSSGAYRVVGPVLESIAAQVDGTACCVRIGPGAAGHFVKMVHNGIEYADMQLLAEAYDLLRDKGGLEPAEIADVFERWGEGELSSFLLTTATTVLRRVDPRTDGPFVDVVRDAAEQKGTGRWTVQEALDLGVPVPAIGEAVFARALSGHTEQRGPVAAALTGPGATASVRELGVEGLVSDLERAVVAARWVGYAQGFDLIRAASEREEWDVDLAQVATIWRGGCIIRASILEDVRAAYDADPHLPTLLVADRVVEALERCDAAWRRAVSQAVKAGVPAPVMSSTLSHVDGLRRDRSPAALIQGLRDVFGAHGYERVDAEGDWHTDWSGDLVEHQR